MKKGKEVLKELYNFEGFSFSEICKENSVIIHMKKKGKTGEMTISLQYRSECIFGARFLN